MRLPGVVFTDGNAASDATQFYNNTEDLNKIDWEVLKAERWTELPDGKRKRCAEVLVPDSISFDSVRRIVVENEHARVAAGHAISFSLPIDVKPEWFF